MTEEQTDIKKRRGNPNWAKGTSGNPNGRPKDVESLTAWIRRLATEKHGTKCNVRLVAEKAWEKARAGDTKAMELILDRLDGKVPQQSDVNLRSNLDRDLALADAVLNDPEASDLADELLARISGSHNLLGDE